MYVRIPLKKELIDDVFANALCSFPDEEEEIIYQIINMLFFKALKSLNPEDFIRKHQPVVHQKTWDYLMSKIVELIEKAKGCGWIKEIDGHSVRMKAIFITDGFGIAPSSYTLDEFQIQYNKEAY